MSKLKIVDFCNLRGEPYFKFWADWMDYDRFEIVQVAGESDEKKREQIKEADIVLSDPYHLDPVTTSMIEASEKLRLIQCYTIGYDDIDLVKAREMGIPVANNAGITAKPMAEYTLMAAMYLTKYIKYAHDQIHAGNWVMKELSTPAKMPLELGGLTFGVIGCGSIGQEVARLAGAFGCKLMYHNRNKLPGEIESRLNLEYMSFDDILAKSDILSINVPLNDSTHGLIRTDEVAKMKKGAVLINTSRGGVVDEHALADALKSGHLKGAAVDVFKDEPDLSNCPLVGLDNVILTPHSSAISPLQMVRAAGYTMENLNRVYQGKEPLRVVN